MMGGVDHLGTRIRAAREAAGLTRSQLAERIGVSARSIAGWENEGVFPRSKAGALEAALGIQLRDATARLEVDHLTDAELVAETARRLARVAELERQLAAALAEIAALRGRPDSDTAGVQ